MSAITLADRVGEQRPALQRGACDIIVAGLHHGGSPSASESHSARARPARSRGCRRRDPARCADGDRSLADLRRPGGLGDDRRSRRRRAASADRREIGGRCAGTAKTVSRALLTPVSTIRLGSSAALAPAMSVSNRSPTTNGLQVAAGQGVLDSAGAGLPATRVRPRRGPQAHQGSRCRAAARVRWAESHQRDLEGDA